MSAANRPSDSNWARLGPADLIVSVGQTPSGYSKIVDSIKCAHAQEVRLGESRGSKNANRSTGTCPGGPRQYRRLESCLRHKLNLLFIRIHKIRQNSQVFAQASQSDRVAV